MRIYSRNLIRVFVALAILEDVKSCIKLLNAQWKPKSLEERTKSADIVVTVKILSTSPIPDHPMFYSATFEVISVLKGWGVLKTLHKRKSKSIISLDPKIIASAKGFGDTRLCFSSVEVGESYALFLGYKRKSGELVVRYDDIFGAADLLYKRTERDILESLGWENWNGWTQCSTICGGGTQIRMRKCQKSTKEPCHGPSSQMKECNTYACNETTDVLHFMLNYESIVIPWRPGGEVFTNAISQRATPTKAPTYLLFTNEYPKDSVLHISFTGPVKDSQYLYSVYNANNKMEFGIKVSPYNLEFVYDKKVDAAVSIRRTNVFRLNFNEDIWYNLAILLKKDEVRIILNCGEVHATSLDKNMFDAFDIYGTMYMGAEIAAGDLSHVKVDVRQITVVNDSKSLLQQCGKLIMDASPSRPPTTPNKPVEPVEISGNGPLSGPDDSESGDIDEEFGSGEINRDGCNCQNGGICQNNGSCSCPSGWSGNKCDTLLCYNKCLNGGHCSNPQTCTCQKGTSGKYCQFTECQLPCKNNGVCIGLNRCKCKPGFEGSQCQHETCSRKCLNGGTCANNGKCKCAKGYIGDRCQFPRNCKQFVTKLVKHLKPVTVYTYVDDTVPCEHNKLKKCKRSRLKYQTINKTYYRPEYFCKT